jgi:hypothetical protein
MNLFREPDGRLYITISEAVGASRECAPSDSLFTYTEGLILQAADALRERRCEKSRAGRHAYSSHDMPAGAQACLYCGKVEP